MTPLKNCLQTLNKIANKKTENTFTDVNFSQLDWHGTLDHKEMKILSVARERKQSKRKSAESVFKSCGADVADCNRHRMTVADEEITDQEKADKQHDATDCVVEALEDIVDRSKKQKN
jgi:hypothetical protein